MYTSETWVGSNHMGFKGWGGEGSNREVVRIESIIFTFYQFTLNSGFISLPGL